MRTCAWLLRWACAASWLMLAAGYTVDCNHDYADCDTEFRAIEDAKTAQDAKGPLSTKIPDRPTLPETTTHFLPTIITPKTEEHKDEVKPKGRLMDMSEYQFTHKPNVTVSEKSKKMDLSDINLDEDEDDYSPGEKNDFPSSVMPNKLLTQLQAPFHPSNKQSVIESDGCQENGVKYRAGQSIARGCEEICECSILGTFECSPRCKHPYIRKGRTMVDPLCFESPVDECCSIIACATGNNGDLKPASSNHEPLEMCIHENNTYFFGAKWDVGCEQRCSCQKNSVVVCEPRCKKLPPSDICINVQDPKDSCCEIQVCDVSQDVHEESIENITSTTEFVITMKPMITSRPLVLPEPIGSIKVLQNNSVQINLIQMNTSVDPIHLELSSDGGNTYKDVELKYSNLLLNLEGGKDYVLKTKETGTKFNFTITNSDSGIDDGVNDILNATSVGKKGCKHDGKFYNIGEEFHIGCSELCECTGDDTKECVVLECPSHVGLEILYKGCVRWAPTPPPQPPNCCPRAARCLSDGTCHYKGNVIPNWSEVPIWLTGCEQRCFCENGELDCQEICPPLSELPPQTLRCQPGHRPAPVNVSDDDCCKEWSCVKNAEDEVSSMETDSMPMASLNYNYVSPILPKTTTSTNVLKIRNDSDINQTPSKQVALTKFINNMNSVQFTDFINTVLNSPISDPKNSNEDVSAEFNKGNIENDVNNVTSNYQFPTNPAYNLFQAAVPPDDNVSKHIPKVIKPQIQAAINESDSKECPYDHLYNLPMHNKTETYPDVDKTSPNSLFNPHQDGYYNSPTQSNPLTPIIEEYADKTPVVATNHMDALTAKEIHQNLKNAKVGDDSVVLKPVKNPKPYQRYNIGKSFSVLDVENLVNNIEIETELSNNVERSNKRTREKRPKAGMSPQDFIRPKPTQPPFLPTVPAEIYPTEEIPEHDQNVIYHPDSREPQLPPLPNYPPGENNKFLVLSVQADSPNSVKMLFGLPPILVGLKGSVDLRYTDKADEDVSRWQSQVFAPAEEILTTPRLEFRLGGLKPSTTYKIKGKLFVHNLSVETESKVFTVRTLDALTIEEKTREIDSHISVLDVNDTTAHIVWRHFTEEELRFIDGIQVRYRPVGTPIYSMTELLHHSRSNAEIHDLRPGIRYEASLVLVPPPKTVTELLDPTHVEFITAPYVDPYNWTVIVETRTVGSEAAEIYWRGIPPPAERWVRVYRAAHACGIGRTREHDEFRLASRDQPNTITLSGLEPNSRCRVWLELFLTNGKVKTSNVLEVNTKSLDAPEPVDNVIEASSVMGGRDSTTGRGNYYGALVAVGVVAALGALTSLLLLLVVVRRHRPHSVSITTVPSAPRESSLPPYDNPAYKLELQQETMDL